MPEDTRDNKPGFSSPGVGVGALMARAIACRRVSASPDRPRGAGRVSSMTRGLGFGAASSPLAGVDALSSMSEMRGSVTPTDAVGAGRGAGAAGAGAPRRDVNDGVSGSVAGAATLGARVGAALEGSGSRAGAGAFGRSGAEAGCDRWIGL